MISLVLAHLLLPLVLIGSPVIGPSVPTYNSPNNAGQSSLGFASILGLTAVLPVGFAAGPRYVPKWKKQACEIPAAQHPNSHYVCDEAGEVKCKPGWIGDLCDVPLCRKGCDPLQGYCRRPGECRCKLGFYGNLCDKCIPLPGCQHGRCNVSYECVCDPGWKGLFCSEPICDSDCHPSQGYCEKPGECICRIGWQGTKCKQCAVLPGCVHGKCQGPLECRCEPGWTGLLCQTPICSQGCSREHGTCRRPGTCRCKVGWTGPNCTECVPYPGCVHGSCRRPWDCRCEPGWAGDFCEEKLTYCDHHSNVCQNNATCVSMTKEDGHYRCICPLGYMGRQCQIQTTIPATELIPPMQELPFTVLTIPSNPSITTTKKSIIDDETIEHFDKTKPSYPSTTTTKKSIIDDETIEHFDKTIPSNPSTTTTKKSIIDDETIEHLDETKPSNPLLFANSHQGHDVEITTEKMETQYETTVEPLETIYITDPSTIDPWATAGKWPTESPTESPTIDNDADNEA